MQRRFREEKETKQICVNCQCSFRFRLFFLSLQQQQQQQKQKKRKEKNIKKTQTAKRCCCSRPTLGSFSRFSIRQLTTFLFVIIYLRLAATIVECVALSRRSMFSKRTLFFHLFDSILFSAVFSFIPSHFGCFLLSLMRDRCSTV